MQRRRSKIKKSKSKSRRSKSRGGGGAAKATQSRRLTRCNPKNRRAPGQCLTPQHLAQISDKDAAAAKCDPLDEVCKVFVGIKAGAGRAKVLNDAFVPARPKKWDAHPREWLTSEDIDRVLHQYASACPHFHYTGFGFIDFAADARVPMAARPAPFQPVAVSAGTPPPAVVARSTAPAPESQDPKHCVMPSICALNLQTLRSKGVTLVASVLNVSRHVEEGTHWVFVVLWLPPRGAAAGPRMVYFDSNADATPPEITAWHRKLSTQCRAIWPNHRLALRSNRLVRQKTNSECGMFCVYSIASIAQGRWLATMGDADAPSCASTESIPRMLDELLDGRTPLTDDLVAQYRNILFRRPAA